jgi:chemotaxis regulatin CheY-phosphate phosphatase CheZ
MNKKERENIFDRVDELKDLFQFGQKVLGFFDGLFQLYQEVLPLLEGINQSIEESSNKLPKASSGLSQVSQATEMATIEILDALDTMSQRIEEGDRQLKDFIVRQDGRTAAAERLIETLKSLTSVIPERDARRLRRLARKTLLGDDDRKFFENLSTQFRSISEHTSCITISLQVQDITSQQLAAITHLVESVHQRLNALLTNFNGAEISKLNEVFHPRPMTFDPNAAYDRSGVRQGLADSLSAQHKRSNPEEDSRPPAASNLPVSDSFDRPKIRTTQEEIDRMFGK